MKRLKHKKGKSHSIELTMGPARLCLHKFSCQFDSRVAQDSAGQFAVTTPCWRDLDRANKLLHEAYESARWSRRENARVMPTNSELIHALCANVARPHHRRYLACNV